VESREKRICRPKESFGMGKREAGGGKEEEKRSKPTKLDFKNLILLQLFVPGSSKIHNSFCAFASGSVSSPPPSSAVERRTKNHKAENRSKPIAPLQPLRMECYGRGEKDSVRSSAEKHKSALPCSRQPRAETEDSVSWPGPAHSSIICIIFSCRES
jgi:hypothetical protein